MFDWLGARRELGVLQMSAEELDRDELTRANGPQETSSVRVRYFEKKLPKRDQKEEAKRLLVQARIRARAVATPLPSKNKSGIALINAREIKGD